MSDEWCMQVFIKGSQNTSQALIDIVRNKTYGEKASHCAPCHKCMLVTFGGINSTSPWDLHQSLPGALTAGLLLQWGHLLPPGPITPWSACLIPSQMKLVSDACPCGACAKVVPCGLTEQMPLRCLCQSGAMRPH